MSSASWFARAQERIPGGVNSPVRAFNAVGGTPVYARRGHGCTIETEDGRTLIDYCGSWGPLILGHSYPPVVEAVRQAAGEGLTFGLNTRLEVELAELIASLAPEMEMLRLVSSGTEATMTALRVARGYTGRSLLLKFDGCYHGHSDAFLVAAGSGVLTGGLAACAGVPPAVAASTLVAPYNDLAAVKAIVERHGADLAAIIVEPVAGNMGLVPPAPGFLAGLRALCDASGALLIFDEVITGFRLGPTTYANLCGVRPDLTTLGKIVGGGLPIGACGGRRDVMQKLAPLGNVYQAGTLSGNPIAVTAGLTTLKALSAAPPYAALERHAAAFASAVNAIATRRQLPLQVAQLGGMFTLYCCAAPAPTDLASAKRCDTKTYARFFHGMLTRGIYLPPAQFEAAFVSAAHGEAELAALIAAATSTIAELWP